MGPGKLVRHMQNPSYTYDTHLICMGQGPSILSVIDKSLLYSGPSYPSSPVPHTQSRVLAGFLNRCVPKVEHTIDFGFHADFHPKCQSSLSHISVLQTTYSKQVIGYVS